MKPNFDHTKVGSNIDYTATHFDYIWNTLGKLVEAMETIYIGLGDVQTMLIEVTSMTAQPKLAFGRDNHHLNMFQRDNGAKLNTAISRNMLAMIFGMCGIYTDKFGKMWGKSFKKENIDLLDCPIGWFFSST